MDTNNNSNDASDTSMSASNHSEGQLQSHHHHHQQQQQQHHLEQEKDVEPQININLNQEAKSDKIELFAKYEPSDNLGQDSGTQTPVDDENHGSEETNDSNTEDNAPTVSTNLEYNDQISTNNNNNINTNSSHSSSTNETTNNNTINDSRPTKAGVVRVQESEDTGCESIELELESDNSLLFTSLTSLFPEATGLKYRHPETNTLRGVKLSDGKFSEPLDGWSSVQNYICVYNRGSKRKIDHDGEDASSSNLRKQSRNESGKQVAIPPGDGGSDLVVLGLPWTTTEETMKSYFEQYGTVVMVQVKTDPKSGKSRGFGFVRFAKSSIQNKLLSMRHFIDGRWCDVRVPLSKAEADATKANQLSRKIFVGRLPDNITTDDLKDHFSEFGTLTDVFIPKPFRNFAFVTFGTSDMAQSIFKHKHIIKGAAVQISEAIPRDNLPNSNLGAGGNVGGGGGGNFGGSNSYGYGGNVSNNNNSIHPFNNYTHQVPNPYFHGKNKSFGGGGGNYGGAMYQNSHKMHQQSTYYQMPSYANSGPSGGGAETPAYVGHGAHNDYGGFGSAASGAYSQPSPGTMNGGQYYKMQQQPIMTPNQNHSNYNNQSSYSPHGANFSRNTYGNSIWK